MKDFKKLLPVLCLTFISLSAWADVDVRDRYIIILKSSNPEEVTKSHGIKADQVYKNLFNGFAAKIPEQALKGIENNPHVEKVIADEAVKLNLPSLQSVQLAPTWGLDRIDQRPLPLDGAYNYDNNGSNVTAYILDTGIIPDHIEFSGRASIGFDAFGGDGRDCQGHGTHVAGTVGSESYGVAKDVRLVGVRVLDCAGSGAWSGVIAGLDWVGGQASGPSVVNMSIGGSFNSSINDAVKRLTQKNVSVVVAAGNSNVDACSTSPASSPEAITVGSINSGDGRSGFSNYGNCLDVFAPGEGIVSTYIGSTTATTGMSGTSMASPHVAGAVALYLSQFPTYSPAQISTLISGSSTKAVVTNALSTNSGLLFSFPDTTVDPGPGPAPEPVIIPNAPGSIFASQGKNGITVSWSDSSSNEDGFELHKSSDGVNFSVLARLAAGGVSYNDRSFTAGATYHYKVRAYNAAGNSNFSSTATITAKAVVSKPGRTR